MPRHAVRPFVPNGTEVTDISDLRYFGRDDHILRYYTTSSRISGFPYTDTIAVSNLRLNVLLPDSFFTIHPPAGYAIDTVRMRTEQPPLAIGTMAPAWTLPDIDGKALSLNEFRGRVAVLDFWYRGCLHCQQAMPRIANIRRKFDPSRVAIIGLNPYDSLETTAPFLRKKHFGYQFAFQAREAVAEYHIAAYPTLCVIGRDGKIIAIHVGNTDDLEEGLEKDIRAALR